MANRYLVATGTWNASNTAIWSATDGGASGASVPTAADDVKFTALSGAVTVTIGGANAFCRSLDCTGFTGTVSHNAGIDLFIGDATAGAGNIALKFVAGMTYTPVNASSSQMQFVSTSATTQDIDFAGKTTGNVIFNASSNGSWKYVGSHTSTGTVTLTNGTLDTNGQTVSWALFASSNSNVRTLTMGSSDITCTTSFTTSTVTNLTITSNTATVHTPSFSIATKNFNGLSIDITGSGTKTFPGNGQTITCANVTRTATAAKADGLSLNGNVVCTGTFTVNGNSVTNRVLVASNTIGTARTITAATVTTSNTDWRDITGAGAASWDLSAITGNSGDCGGNTNITFTTATTQTATGTASFTWSTHGWTSRVPLPQDTVSVPNSFTAGRTITADMPRLGKDITFSCTGTPNLSFATNVEILGNLTFTTTMGTINGNVVIGLANRSPMTLTTGGNTIGGSGSLRITGTSSITLGGALVYTGAIDAAGTGWLVTNNYNITCLSFQLFGAVPSTSHDLGTSTVTVTNTGSSTVVGLTTNPTRQGASNATFVISAASSNTRTVAWYGGTIGTLTYTVASSTGVLQLGNSAIMGTINTLNLGSARTLQLLAGATLTVGTFNPTGASWPYVYTGGGASHTINTPNSAAISVTGDIDIRFFGAADDWSPAGVSQAYVEKSSAYLFYGNPSGSLVFVGGGKTLTSTANVAFADGADGWVRCTVDVNDGAGNTVAKFWTSTDGNTWSQLGSTVTSAGTISLTDNANVLRIAQQGTATGFKGKIYRAQVRNNILDDGTGIVFDADFTTKTWGTDSFTESSSNAATVTLDGAFTDGAVRLRSSVAGSAATISKASGEVSGRYLLIKDCAATGGATFNAVDSTNVSGNTGWNFITSWVPKTIWLPIA